MKDVNDIGFRLVFGPRDWTQRMTAVRPSTEGSVVWDDDQGAVHLRAKTPRFPRSQEDDAWTPDGRRGTARDRYGTWYAVTDDRTGIRVRPPGREGEERFWPVDDPAVSDRGDTPAGAFRSAVPSPEPEPASLHGLAVTARHYLVVGMRDPGGLLIFDLHGGGPPERLPWPSDVPMHPVDLTARPGGGLWVLDRSPDDTYDPRLWTLDRAFRVVAPAGTACVDGDEPASFRPARTGIAPGEADRVGHVETSLTVDLAFDLGPETHRGRPVAIEALPDDTVLVLRVDAGGSTPTSTVTRYAPLDAQDPRRGRIRLDDLLEAVFDADGWQAHDVAVRIDRATPRPVQGVLYAAGTDGLQALAFDLEARSDDLRLTLRKEFIPLRRFGGRGLTAEKEAVYYDSDDRWVRLAPRPRARYVLKGTITTRRPFDSDVPGTTWHRVFLDACIPSDASVRIESRSADKEHLLASEPWTEEPAPYERDAGSELPYDRPFEDADASGTGTWEVLLQNAHGRYLQLRMTLRGNGRTTPRLYAVRVYAPRFSYLTEYLPDVYQDDPTSADFLERFLANPEGLFTALEGRIAEAQQLFDTRTVPSEYLDWLAGWLGASFDTDLNDDRRRLFLDHAMDLYRRRGTLGGLLALLRLVLHPCPDASIFDEPGSEAPSHGDARLVGYDVRIVEAFRTRSQPPVRLGDPSDPLQPRLLERGTAWTLDQGVAVLHERFRSFLDLRYDSAAARGAVWPDPVVLPPLRPEGSEQRDDWRAFTQRELSVPYADVAPDDTRARDRFRTFLARRHTVSELQAIYGTDRVDDVSLPATFPESQTRLADWMQFATFVLPIREAAHRFTVLVPARPDDTTAAQRQRLDLVRRIVTRERPVHTAFDIQPYWALFRVGAVRVAYDTVLGEGSRYAALVLDDTDLADGVLASAHPFDVADRRVVGRDAASSSPPL